MQDAATTNWRDNTIAECLPDWKKETVEKMMPIWKKDTIEKMMPIWEKETVEKMMPIWEKETVEKMMPIWEKNYHDQRMRETKIEALSQVAKNLAARGVSAEEISAITGLTLEEVQSTIQ